MYKIGDRVYYSPKKHKAKVIRVHRTYPHNEYDVEFEDKALIPPQMTVPEHLLSKIEHDPMYEWASSFYGNRINKETHCPRCGNEWKETYIGRSTFYDCMTCNLKKEDA